MAGPSDDIRSAIRKYENQQKVKGLADVGTLASLGLTGVGAFKRKMLPTILGLTGAGVGGYLSGRASGEGQKALEKVRRHHEIDTPQKLINLSAILPERKKVAEAALQKEAVVGGAVHALVEAFKGGIPWPLGLDLLFLPAVARAAGKSTRKALHVAAKQHMGMPLTPGEKTRAAAINIASAVKDKAHSIKNPTVRGVADYMASYAGPYATAAKAGPVMGKALKEVEKISPRYSNMLVDAIPGGPGQAKLFSNTKKDTKKYLRALEILRETRSGKMLKDRGGAGGSSILKRYLENPNQAIHDARKFKQTEDNLVNAVKFTAIAGAGAGAANLAARHMTKEKPDEAFWSGFDKQGGKRVNYQPLFGEVKQPKKDDHGPVDPLTEIAHIRADAPAAP